MFRLNASLPALGVMVVLIGAWWIAVVTTHSMIFPTPWAVVTGTWELLKNGTLWDHIGASLMRVGIGFGLAVCVASPVYLIFISSVFPMVVQTTVGVHTIEKRYLRAAQNFGVSRRTLFTHVVIPAVLPQII